MQVTKESISFMGIFNKKTAPASDSSLFDLIDEPAEPEVNHNSVLDYMVALGEDDYKKLIKVADVYRAANKKADDILGKTTDGEKIEVRVIEKAAGTNFLETDGNVKKELEVTNVKKTK